MNLPNPTLTTRMNKNLSPQQMAAQMERFSQFFYTICSETGGIEGLLHSFFAFLLYKTDFYYEMERPGEKQGFPPGYAERMVTTVFKQYQQEQC